MHEDRPYYSVCKGNFIASVVEESWRTIARKRERECDHFSHFTELEGKIAQE